MIQAFTNVLITDNTGVRTVMCLRNLGNNKTISNIGDVFIGVVKMVEPNVLIKKSEILKIYILRTRKKIRRKDGSYVQFQDNSGIIINRDNNKPKALRIFGPSLTELRKSPYKKVYSILNETL